MIALAFRGLVRNGRRTLAACIGVVLGVGMLSGVLFFADAAGAAMTRRALQPIVLDMQAVLRAPLGRGLRLDERIVGPRSLRVGEEAAVELTVANRTAVPAHEVVVNDEPAAPLTYVARSASINGGAIQERPGQNPLAQGLARTGMNIGTVSPGATVRIVYRVRARRPVADLRTIALAATISSREDVVPSRANSRQAPSAAEVRARIARVPGVAGVDLLEFVDLPARSVAAAGHTLLDVPIRLFAFDAEYQQAHPAIRIVHGSMSSGDGASVSSELLRALGQRPGGALDLALPGRVGRLPLTITGEADLSHADALFASRKASKLEDVLYVPFAVVVTPRMFERAVIPAFRTASATPGTIVKSLPASELDLRIERSQLHGNPGVALAQTRAIARAVHRVASDQVALIDNISNALEVARDDAAVGKRMFAFLGLPGILVAALLTAFGTHLFAEAQRREQATLRLHGAGHVQLLRFLALSAAVLAAAGSITGVAAGLLAARAVIGRATLAAVPNRALVQSAAFAACAGFAVTAVALYVSGRRFLHQEVIEERRELSIARRPVWQRWWLDIVLLFTATATALLDRVASPVEHASVAAGRSFALPTRRLFAPMAILAGSVLVAARILQWVASRRAPAPGNGFGSFVAGTFRRSLARRAAELAPAITIVALIAGLTANTATFAATYEAAKRVDSRFAVGSDLRLTPSVQSERPYTAVFAGRLRVVPGVAAVTPIVFRPENSVLVGPFDQNRTDLAAIDPQTYRTVAAPSRADAAIDALSRQPAGVLVRTGTADDLSIGIGSRVRILLARGTKQQAIRRYRVVGLFDAFAGFPRGVDLVVGLRSYTSATRITKVDWFLARTTDTTSAGVARATAAIRQGPGRADPLHVDTPYNYLDRNQSSLTALNVRGTLHLVIGFTTVMSAAAVTMFVFGLLLHRRREYLVLRALGASTGRLLALILAETALIAVGGLAVGTPSGIAMAHVFVRALRPLFVLDPRPIVPLWRLVLHGALVVSAGVLAAVVALVTLKRSSPTAILREE